MKSGDGGIYAILFVIGWLVLVGLIILVKKLITKKAATPDQKKGVINLYIVLGLFLTGLVIASLIIFNSIG